MSTGDYLDIHPSELKFPFGPHDPARQDLSVHWLWTVELKMRISCSFQLTNKTDQYIAFKVKTTTPKKYCVRPNNGILLPGSVCNITVIMQAQKEAPPGMQCKDKFLVLSVVAPNGATAKDITVDMFKGKQVVKEFKFRAVYVPVTEESEEGYSTLVEEGSQSSSRPDVSLSQISKLTDEKEAALEQIQKLQQELALLRKEAVKTRSGGYSILFVVLIVTGIVSLVLGYLIKQQEVCGFDIHFKCKFSSVS